MTIMEESMEWYDLWTFEDGNIAYIQTNIDSTNMAHLEKEIVKNNPRKEDEDFVSYVNRFIKFLEEDDNIVLNILNRPANAIRLESN